MPPPFHGFKLMPIPLAVTVMSIVTVWPLASVRIAAQVDGLGTVPALFAVTVIDVAVAPGAGENVGQFPVAEASWVVYVSLLIRKVDAGDSVGTSVAV